MTKLINLSEITLSQAFLVRESINNQVVDDYVESLALKAVFPPIHVFKSGRGYVLADGWHRVYAFRKAKKKSILAEVHEGDELECLRFCLQSNQEHGLRRTNADKRRAVKLALGQLKDMNESEVAKLCGVSHTYVAKIKSELDEEKAHVASNGGVTPRNIQPRASAPPPDPLKARMSPASPVQTPDVVSDAMGYPVPDKVMDYWSRSFEVQSVIEMVEDLERVIDLAESSKDVLWHEAVFQTARADLSRVRQNIETAKPYAVCTNCQGQLPETCTLCGGKGFISKFRFDTLVPEEIREMRKKACAELKTKTK